MLYTREHLTAYLRWQGHDADDVLRRVQSPASQVHDMEAWGIAVKWYQQHSRQTYEHAAEVLNLPKWKVEKGFELGRYFNSDKD